MKLRPFVCGLAAWIALAALPLRAADATVSPATAVAPPVEAPLSLDGIWAFTIDPALAAAPGVAGWDRLTVPGNWDTVNAYAQHIGAAWYRREFAVPPAWTGRRVRLNFGAVYESAEVFLNDVSLGRHDGGYLPFDFDITDRVRRDAPNVVTVRADNTFRRGAWWAWGGISRSVTLTSHHAVRLVRQHVRAEPDLAARTAEIFIEYKLENAAAAPAAVRLATEVPGVGRVETAVSVPAAGTTLARARLTVPTAALRLWHFDHPKLYALSTAISLAPTDPTPATHRTRFGIRRVEIKPDGLYLNGEKVRLVGFNRVHDHRAYGNTEPEHLVRLDVDLMKRFGGNFMRIMHAPSSPNLLDYLDEKGVMIFAEIPVWGQGDPNVVADNPRTKLWLREMIERDYNHPSIVGWSPGNELMQHRPYVKSMIDYARRELDPHRLHAYVSFTGGRSDYGPANDPITDSDLIFENTYGGDPGLVVSTLTAKWPGRPIFLSEFGTRQFGESPTSRIPGLDERWSTLAGFPHLIGVALWTFNDYRSDYVGSEPGQLRSWGIVDQWRQPKDAARDVARLHSPVRALRAFGTTATLSPRRTDEFPSFTLRGYHLLWEWRARNGTTLGGGVRALPDITPGTADLKFELAGQPSGPFDHLVVTLVGPTGYVAHEFATQSNSNLAPIPAPTATSAPRIIRAYPITGGFWIAYSQQPDDTTFALEYGTAPGRYTEKLTVTMKGATAVRGLVDGTTYYGRLRREPTGRAPGAWSAEFTVTPDGGRPPAAPVILGVVRSAALVAVRLAPVEKATAYRLSWGPTAADSLLVNAAAPGPVIIKAPAGAANFTATAINAHGESTPSLPASLPALVP